VSAPDDFVDVTPREISRQGMVAARAFSLTLIGSATGLIIFSWDDVWRVCGSFGTPCEARSAGAMLLTIGSVAAIGWGVGIQVRLRRRIIDPSGSSRYVWALGVLLALACVFIAARIPAFTCGRGHFDDALAICMHPPSTSDPTSWLLLKKAIVVIGLIAGVVVSARAKNVRVTAPLAIVVWLVGFGWLIIDTMM
jgi:hypothetical protein